MINLFPPTKKWAFAHSVGPTFKTIVALVARNGFRAAARRRSRAVPEGPTFGPGRLRVQRRIQIGRNRRVLAALRDRDAPAATALLAEHLRLMLDEVVGGTK